jgi:hypothetical protein
MAMQRMEIHFIIDPRGHIQSVVKGVKGSGCKALVKEIKKLGLTLRESPTGEFFEKAQDGIIRVTGKEL